MPATLTGPNSIIINSSFTLTPSGYTIPVGARANLYLTGTAQPIQTEIIVNVPISLTAPATVKSLIYYVALNSTPTVKIVSKTIAVILPPISLTGPNSAVLNSSIGLVIANYTIPQGLTLKIFLTGLATPVVSEAIIGTNTFLAPATGTSAVYYIALSNALTVKLASKTITLMLPNLVGPLTAYKNEKVTLSLENYILPQGQTLNLYAIKTDLIESNFSSKKIVASNFVEKTQYYVALSSSPSIKIASLSVNVTEPPPTPPFYEIMLNVPDLNKVSIPATAINFDFQSNSVVKVRFKNGSVGLSLINGKFYFASEDKINRGDIFSASLNGTSIDCEWDNGFNCYNIIENTFTSNQDVFILTFWKYISNIKFFVRR